MFGAAVENFILTEGIKDKLKILAIDMIYFNIFRISENVFFQLL